RGRLDPRSPSQSTRAVTGRGAFWTVRRRAVADRVPGRTRQTPGVAESHARRRVGVPRSGPRAAAAEPPALLRQGGAQAAALAGHRIDDRRGLALEAALRGGLRGVVGGAAQVLVRQRQLEDGSPGLEVLG